MTNDLTHTAEWSTADKRNLVFDPDPPGTPLPPNSVVGPLHSKSTHHEMERKRHEYQSDDDDYDFKDQGQTTGGTSTHHVWITDTEQHKDRGVEQVRTTRPLVYIDLGSWRKYLTLENHVTGPGQESGSKNEHHYFYHEDSNYNPQGTKDGDYTKNENRTITNTTAGQTQTIYAQGPQVAFGPVFNDAEFQYSFSPSSTSYSPQDYSETGNHTDNEGIYTTTSGGVTGQPSPYTVGEGEEWSPPEVRGIEPPVALTAFVSTGPVLEVDPNLFGERWTMPWSDDAAGPWDTLLAYGRAIGRAFAGAGAGAAAGAGTGAATLGGVGAGLGFLAGGPAGMGVLGAAGVGAGAVAGTIAGAVAGLFDAAIGGSTWDSAKSGALAGAIGAATEVAVAPMAVKLTPAARSSQAATEVRVVAGECAAPRAASVLDAASFVGKKAITPPHLPAGTFPALVVDGRVYVARMHITAWELAQQKGVERFYGFAEIDAAGKIVRLFK